MDWTAIVIALIGVAGGSVGTALMQGFVKRKDEASSQQRQERQDFLQHLSKEIGFLRAEIEDLKKSHDDCEERWHQCELRHAADRVRLQALEQKLGVPDGS